MSTAPTPTQAAPHRNGHAIGSFGRLAWPDLVFLLLLLTFLFALCAVRSRHRLLWADELYGYQVLASPTLAGTLRGWREGADGGGLLYYLLGRLWMDLFGLSALTLRLFSTAGMSASIVLLWISLRRYMSLAATVGAIAAVYLTAPNLLWQAVNGRFYGLFLAVSAFAALCFLLGNDDPTHEPPAALLLCTALAHAALIGSHILGLVYSFALIVLTVLLGALQRHFRPRLLLAQLTGWLVLPVSLHAMRASASIATTTFWTQRPSPILLLAGLAAFGRLTQWLLFFAMAGAVAATLVRAASQNRRSGHPLPVFLAPAPAALVAALVLAQGILFAKSQHGISIYADRYLLPLSLASAFLFAACFERILAVVPTLAAPHWRPVALSFALLAACVVYAAGRDVNYALYPPQSYLQAVPGQVPAGAPILLTNPAFNLLSHYDPAHTYLFMTDWAFDLAPQRAGQDFSGERLMENWQRAGYQPGHILPCQQLFARYPDLYILIDFHRSDWFAERIQQDPRLQVRVVHHVAPWWPSDLWHVHRLTPGPPPC